MQEDIIKSAMRNGIILGLLFSLNFLLQTYKSNPAILLSNVTTIIIVVTTYRLTNRFKLNECDGILSYKKSFLYIVLLFFYASLISIAVKLIYFKLNPDFLSSISDNALEYIKSLKMGITETEIIEQSKSLENPINYSLANTWFNMILGVITAFYISFKVRTKNTDTTKS